MEKHPDVEPPTLQHYEAVTPKICKTCGGKLSRIEFYPHSGGWLIFGYMKRQWLYRTCLKCGYQWSLLKLGIDLDYGDSLLDMRR